MWARIIDAAGVPTVAEVVTTDPATIFTPEIAELFVPAEPGMVYRAEFRDGDWVPPPEPESLPTPVPPPPTTSRRKNLTAPEFKLLFSPQERIAIRTARAYSGNDPQLNTVKAVLDDFYEILDDPRLKEVNLALPQTQEGVMALAQFGFLTEARAAEILEGVEG